MGYKAFMCGSQLGNPFIPNTELWEDYEAGYNAAIFMDLY
jgi:hypothetical protein